MHNGQHSSATWLSQGLVQASEGSGLALSSLVRNDKDPLEGTERIIFAEDDPGVRKSTVLLLKDFGYDVDAYAGGPEALVAIAKDARPVELLLTDFNMPGLTGYELAQRVRQLRPKTRVLIASGLPEEIIAPAIKPDDWPPYIAKPFTCRTLGSKLREILDSPQLP